MRTCSECGADNTEGDDFCGNCGAYLGWSAPAPAASAGDVPPGTVPPGTGSPGATAPGAPEGGVPAADAAPPGTAAAAGADDGARQADPDLVAVRPARPATRRPVVRPFTPETAQNGPPCPRCGTPNESGRRFCRRCAAPLAGTAVAAPLPWWRSRRRSRRRVRAGGSGDLVRRLVMLLLLVALVFGGIRLFPAARAFHQKTRDKLGGVSVVAPDSVTASASLPGHPAADTVDGKSNRYWAAPALGASVTFRFHTPFRLIGILITTGASPDPAAFRSQARATVLDLLVDEANGTPHEQTLRLNDAPGSQQVRTGISDVVEVRLTVREAAGTGPGRHIALGEVEFRERAAHGAGATGPTPG
ncbi:NADase-type glycan-binding domain-containing protein [Streptantibioticus silvisoli]|uniref:Zinc ribbon domain-containing protein n=1 Tax=Streptantibioticus silvisoli TaxID=2705255 RepID=A0ABT6VUP9_9ACTN|nr:zinc-ribbon domain-containing protein [Streptantibioticus silvisoli]MDI5961173.1 zinc ribbon domain-containing protein [Streptantibioticus silvisoli]